MPSPALLCFVEGTLVETSEGAVPIEEIELGDLVWSRNDETGEEDWKPVVETFITEDKVVFDLGFLQGGEDVNSQLSKVERKTTPTHMNMFPSVSYCLPPSTPKLAF